MVMLDHFIAMFAKKHQIPYSSWHFVAGMHPAPLSPVSPSIVPRRWLEDVERRVFTDLIRLVIIVSQLLGDDCIKVLFCLVCLFVGWFVFVLFLNTGGKTTVFFDV